MLVRGEAYYRFCICKLPIMLIYLWCMFLLLWSNGKHALTIVNWRKKAKIDTPPMGKDQRNNPMLDMPSNIQENTLQIKIKDPKVFSHNYGTISFKSFMQILTTNSLAPFHLLHKNLNSKSDQLLWEIPLDTFEPKSFQFNFKLCSAILCMSAYSLIFLVKGI